MSRAHPTTGERARARAGEGWKHLEEGALAEELAGREGRHLLARDDDGRLALFTGPLARVGARARVSSRRARQAQGAGRRAQAWQGGSALRSATAVEQTRPRQSHGRLVRSGLACSSSEGSSAKSKGT